MYQEEGLSTYPEAMYPRLSRVAIQSGRVWVSRKSIHDRPTDTACLVDLKAEVIVRACNRVVMLMDDKMSTLLTSSVGSI